MAIARFKDLCIDANDPARLGEFWAAVVAREWRPDDAGEGIVAGATPAHGIWINRVPEPKTVKHRVHLDIYARSLADLEALGATIVRPPGEHGRWTVMNDPEGGEFCAFLRDDLPADLVHGVVIDTDDPAAQAQWWGSVYDAAIVHHDDGYSTVENVPGMPILTMDFVPVPEPKTVKNRVHWDVWADDVAPLVAAGATVLREPDDEVRWHVLADPEGNEFCAFRPE